MLIGLGREAKDRCYVLAKELRALGVSVDHDLMDRSVKAQMKYAGKSGIPFLAVIGDDELASGEVKVKCMADGSETVVKLDGIGDFLAGK